MSTAYELSERAIAAASRDGQDDLDLGGYDLDVLPPGIGQLTSLKRLDLGENRLSALPPEIWQLTGLKSINLENNLLSALPPEIGQLRALEHLDVAANELRVLPPEFGRLIGLKTLNLSENRISSIPPEIGGLAELESLDLGDNNLNVLAEQICQLTALTTLKLGRNRVNALPPEIRMLTALRSLDLISNRLTAVPPQIGQLTALERLDLDGNRLSSLPGEIGHLVKLEFLDLRGNQLRALPPEIGKLTALRSLFVMGNQLSELPPEIGLLNLLEVLELGRNQLRVMPPAIGRLTSLSSLSLNENELVEVPPWIGQLTALQQLDLSANRLTALPAELGQLLALANTRGLRRRIRRRGPYIGRPGLHIGGNSLPHPYPALVRAGEPSATRNVLAWLRGELDATSLPESDGPLDSEAPVPREQGVGLHFEINESGIIAFAPPEALDREGNNVGRLRRLHPVLRSLSADVVQALGTGNVPHSYLQTRAAAYRDVVDQALEAIDFFRLYVEGVRLANADRAALLQIDAGELPPLEPPVREALNSLHQMHGTFLMSTIEGIAAIAEEERYQRRPHEEQQYRAAAVEFATSLQDRRNVIDPRAARLVLGAAEQIGRGANPERGGVVGTGAVRNVAITLAAGAAFVAFPTVGALALGLGGAGAAAVGTIVGTTGYLVAGEGLKKSKPFREVRELITRKIDAASEADISTKLEAIAALLRPHFELVRDIEPSLRRLAGQRDEFSWINTLLDWLKRHHNR